MNFRPVRVTAHIQRSDPESPFDFFRDLREAVEVVDHRVQFRVKRSLKREPNPAEVTITNLARANRDAFVRRPLRVKLEAGTRDEVLRFIYAGDVKPNSRNDHEGTEWLTKLVLGDGHRAYKTARVNRAYAAGTTMRTILRDAARSLGLDLPENLGDDSRLDARINVGATVSGWTSDELTRLLAPYGYSWSIQDSRLQVLRTDEVRTDTLYQVDVENGMKGSPKWGTAPKNGGAPNLLIVTELRPELSPGVRIRVKSKEVSGDFKIVESTLDGDTHGDAWDNQIEAKPL